MYHMYALTAKDWPGAVPHSRYVTVRPVLAPDSFQLTLSARDIYHLQSRQQQRDERLQAQVALLKLEVSEKERFQVEIEGLRHQLEQQRLQMCTHRTW